MGVLKQKLMPMLCPTWREREMYRRTVNQLECTIRSLVNTVEDLAQLNSDLYHDRSDLMKSYNEIIGKPFVKEVG